jgi:hypothetical protein
MSGNQTASNVASQRNQTVRRIHHDNGVTRENVLGRGFGPRPECAAPVPVAAIADCQSGGIFDAMGADADFGSPIPLPADQ